MKNIGSDRIVPVIRNNAVDELLPTFLSTRLYADFRDEYAFESPYAELLRTLHNQPVTPRPPLGQNPFTSVVDVEPRVAFAPERNISAALSGTVTFDYSNNNGRFVLGTGDMLFETAWSGGGSRVIHVYCDPPSIRTVALVTEVEKISDIEDAAVFDTSSRVRSPHLNEIVI